MCPRPQAGIALHFGERVLPRFVPTPFFGVGFNNLPEYTDNHLTAHNTVIVCASELGLLGFYFWSVFLLASASGFLCHVIAGKGHRREVPIDPESNVMTLKPISTESLTRTDINILGRSVLLALVGYLVAGWFLSRAIVITLFMLGGLSEVVYQMAL